MISVFIGPGAIALTGISGASSLASENVKLINPAFEAA